MENNSMMIGTDFISDLAISINRLEKLLRDSKNSTPDNFLSFKEAQNFLGLSESHLRKLVFESKIPVNRAGRKLVFSKQELKEWIKKS